MRKFLLTAMISRVIAQELRQQLRSVRAHDRDARAHTLVVVNYFNAVLGHSVRADCMWRSELKLLLVEMYTQRALDANEIQSHADPRRYVSVTLTKH